MNKIVEEIEAKMDWLNSYKVSMFWTLVEEIKRLQELVE